jgi:uncharacterized protein
MVTPHRWNPFLHFPVVSLAATFLFLAPLIWQGWQVRLVSEPEVLLESDPGHLSTYEKARELLAGVEVLVLSLEAGDVFTLETMEVLRQVSESFMDSRGVVDVKSFTHSIIPVRQGWSFQMIPLVSANPTVEELKKLREFSLTHPLIRDVMVSRDGRHTLITVTYRAEFETPASQERLRREVEEVLEPFRAGGWNFHFLSMPIGEAEIRSELKKDIRWFIPAAVIVLVAILWAAFGSWPVVGLVCLHLAVLLMALAGLLSLSGVHAHLFTMMLLPLWGGIYLTLLAHVFSAWQKALEAGKSDPVFHVLEAVFKPCAFAALTTGIGLLSLGLSEVRQVREFGLLGAAGIALLFMAAFGPGVAILKLWPTRSSGQGQPSWRGVQQKRAARWAAFFVVEFRRSIWVVFTILLGLLVFGLGKMETRVRAADFLPPASQTRQALAHMDGVYGGVNIFQLEIDSGKAGGANQLDFLRYLEEAQRFAEVQEGVSAVYSYPQLLAMMNQIWEGGKPEALQLPENSLLLNVFVLALKSKNFPFLNALADPEFQTAYLVVRTPDLDSTVLLETIRRIVARAEELAPAGVSISAGPGVHSVLEADRRILRSQLRSAGVTLGVITLVLALLWRSVSLALLASLTNALPVGLMLAMAGLAEIPLNSITVMVAAIAFGIAVDDSVHFITHWKRSRATGGGQSLLDTYQVKGRPIISSSLILVAVFSLFAICSFPPVRHFGILAAFAFAGALLAILFFLPAALSLRDDGEKKLARAQGKAASPQGSA